VQILRDALDIGKNVIIARKYAAYVLTILIFFSFHLLSKPAIVRMQKLEKRSTYIDVWPFVESGSNEAVLTTSLMMAYVLSRTDIWKKCSILRLLNVAEGDEAVGFEQRRLEEYMDRYGLLQ